MKLENFDEANEIYSADIENADPVPAWKGLSPGPFSPQDPTIIICWKLDPLEVQELIKTGRIWLWLYNLEGVPIHAVTTASPFEKPVDPETN